MKSAGCLNGKFFMVYTFSGTVATHLCAITIYLLRMVHEAELPKPKQHGMRAAKAKREEMLKHAEASAAGKTNSTT
jgi:hypothetical protein